jgi:hypothetical protein
VTLRPRNLPNQDVIMLKEHSMAFGGKLGFGNFM